MVGAMAKATWIGLVAASIGGSAERAGARAPTLVGMDGADSFTVAPASGPIGTPVTVSISPQVNRNRLNATSRASWVGVYQPLIGSPSAPFTVNYSAAQFAESGPWQATILIGDGSFTNAPNSAAFAAMGTLVGTLTITTDNVCISDVNSDGLVDFLDLNVVLSQFGQTGPNLQGDANGDGVVDFLDLNIVLSGFGVDPCGPLATVVQSAGTNFAPATNAGKWFTIGYPDGPGGMAPPVLGIEPTDLQMLLPNVVPPSQAALFGGSDFHLAAVVKIAENASTIATSPATLNVDVLTVTSGGAQVDRKPVTLTKLASDGDPANITYSSSLSTPIVLADAGVNLTGLTGFIFVRGTTGGRALIVPATP